MKDTTELLHDAIDNELEELADYETYPEGSDIRKAKLDEVSKLIDRLTEYEKVQMEASDRSDSIDHERKTQKIKNRQQWLNIIATGIAIPVVGMIWTFRFDKTGTITSTLGRKILNGLLPNKH